jgi:hypothetical protein
LLPARNFFWNGMAMPYDTAAAMQNSWPTRSEPPCNCQAPSTTIMPRKPISRPSTRCRVNFSVRNASTAMGSTTSGVIPFQMPASNEGMRCSPYPNKVQGTAEPIAPATKL